jgi:hypothetical protein
MKSILEFDLPEDDYEFTMATKGHKYFMVLWDYNNYLKTILKHGDLKVNERNIINKVHHELFEIMKIKGVDFDEVE